MTDGERKEMEEEDGRFGTTHLVWWRERKWQETYQNVDAVVLEI